MSPGPEFFQTMMGRKFYDADVPRIANALERIATALEMLEGQVRADSLNANAGGLEAKCGEDICCDDPNCSE